MWVQTGRFLVFFKYFSSYHLQHVNKDSGHLCTQLSSSDIPPDNEMFSVEYVGQVKSRNKANITVQYKWLKKTGYLAAFWGLQRISLQIFAFSTYCLKLNEDVNSTECGHPFYIQLTWNKNSQVTS